MVMPAAAFVNAVQYKNYSLALTTAYDDANIFTISLQLMYQTPIMTFTPGSGNMTQPASILSATVNHSRGTTDPNGSYTAANIFLGFSLNLGR